MSLIEVEICITTDIDNPNECEIASIVEGKIIHTTYSPDEDEETTVQIGKIRAYRFFAELEDVIIWADELDQDFHFAVDWLTRQEETLIDLGFLKGFVFIRWVEIEPQWRGRGITLKAIATFLKVLANGGSVFLMPLPRTNTRSFEEHERRALSRIRFWKKLGITHHDSKANILWEPEWYCPQWLSEKSPIDY